MSLDILRRRIGTLWLLLTVLALAGCGGGTADTLSHLRLLNAAPDVSAANLYSDDNQEASGIVPDAISDYAELNPGSHTIKVTDAIGVTLASADQSFDKNVRYTAIAWGRGGAIGLALLTEADSDTRGMASGWGRLRVFNGAGTEAGKLDLYLVPVASGNVDLSTVTPVMTSTTTTVTAYSNLLAGTYQLIVTAEGDSADVRLDLPAVTLGDQQLLTVVLEPSAGGSLVHALLLAHQGSLAVAKNTNARVRLVASVANSGSVLAGVGGTMLSDSALVSPQIGSYRLVPAGTALPAVTVNGVGVGANDTSLAAGADYTLLVAGPAAAPVAKTIQDDNRLPTNSAKLKIRLLDGFLGAGAATLTVNSVGAGTVVAPPDASAYTQINASSSASASVTSTTAGSLWATDSSTTTTLAAGSVYTAFILDGNADASAKGQLLSER